MHLLACYDAGGALASVKAYTRIGTARKAQRLWRKRAKQTRATRLLDHRVDVQPWRTRILSITPPSTVAGVVDLINSILDFYGLNNETK